MDLPKHPEDQELRNIIDKLAQFVARNGLEFEQMTKNKQKDNPKFGFLFGGEYFNYYQYKVTTEQAILKQKQKALEQQQVMNQPSVSSSPWSQQQQLQEQIQQSERNLAAQHHVLMQQQQLQVEEAIRKSQDEKLHILAKDCGIELVEAERIMQPIIDSCTKDSISAGKGWIFNRGVSATSAEVIARYLVKRITALGASFELKLHLVYLINDVLHHCLRKNAEDLKRVLGMFVVPIFCTTCLGASDDQQIKLSKLLKLWETNKYFEPAVIEQLKNPASSLAAYKAGLISEHSIAVSPITASIQTQYAALQKQHQDFVNHITSQLQPFASQNTGLKQSQPTPMQQQPMPVESQQSVVAPIQTQPQNVPAFPPAIGAVQQQLSLSDTSTSCPTATPDSTQSLNKIGSNQNVNFSQPPPGFLPHFSQPPPHFTQPPPGFPPAFQQPPPNFSQLPTNTMPLPPFCPGMPLPDLTKPPPGFPPQFPPINQPPAIDPNDVNAIPNVPYFELPAGLMTVLVKLEDYEYKPLDPNDIKLPAPAPPSDRLLSAVELFYAPPSHDRPRNSSEGWEQLGLYEFFKAKSHAKKKKEEDIREGKLPRSPRSKSRSRSRERQTRAVWSPSPPRRRYREEGKSTVYNRPRSISPVSHSRSSSQSRSRSRSKSPPRYNRRSSRSRSRSRSHSPSPSRNKRKRSSSRSPTPPSFFGGSYATPTLDHRLDESNKGHQLLRKMGWGGAGLGAAEQGIQEPISGGEVRDRQDQYKGIGINMNDPFESFRKSKGQAFINRMKARAEEKLNQ